MDVLERLSPAYWWTDPGTTIDGPFFVAFAIVLALIFLLSVVVWILGPRMAPDNRFHQRLILRLARWSFALSATGLALLLFRWQMVPFLSKRLWLFLWFATVMGLIGYLVYYWRRVYPIRMAAWGDSERRRRYLPKSGHGSARSRRRSRRRR